MQNIYGLIMAGGEGTRFAPLSTPECPKQFLSLFGEGSFLQQTQRRIQPLTPPDKLYVATQARYVDLVRAQLPDIPAAHIIGEPCKKNTAPCIAYVASLIARHDPNGVLVVLPADHVIQNESRFQEVIAHGVRIASEAQQLVVLGIEPTWPATGYGYIRRQPEALSNFPGAYRVQQFVEKPNMARAESYIQSKDYAWNAGIFIFPIRQLLAEVAQHLPAMAQQLTQHAGKEFFSAVEAISIDYGVLEHSTAMVVIPCDIGWSDVGSWESLHQLRRAGLPLSPTMERKLLEMFGRSPQETRSLPYRVDKPWGHEEVWAGTSAYIGKILFIKKGHRLSQQYHRMKEETLRVLSGVVEFSLESMGAMETRELKAGDVIHVPPVTRHRLRALEDAEVLEVSTPYINDVVRIEDDYGR